MTVDDASPPEGSDRIAADQQRVSRTIGYMTHSVRGLGLDDHLLRILGFGRKPGNLFSKQIGLLFD